MLERLKIMRQSTSVVRTPVVLASAVASITVLVVVVVVSSSGGARTDPAMLYDRWVKVIQACDTKRDDSVMTIDAGGFTGSTDGGVPLRMRVVSVAPKPPDGLELKLQSYARPDFVLFVPFTVKDATTVVSETGVVWRKCL